MSNPAHLFGTIRKSFFQSPSYTTFDYISLGRGLRVKSPGDPVESLSFDDCPPGSASFLEICHLRSSSR
ncbi:hypothetical protein ABH19_11880 [Leptospirillum sp. Group II 'CF-1']|nr:hypothetical protein ABH19_11880 [Leptospirillum sp. Group II 'CF-1']